MGGREQLAGELAADLRRTQRVLARRVRLGRARIASGAQPGLDGELDRDLRDAMLLRAMVAGLQEALAMVQACQPAPHGSRHSVALSLPPALAGWLPAPHAAVVRLRGTGATWSQVGSALGIQPSNAVRAHREVSGLLRDLAYIRELAASGAGEREIARRLGLPLWGVRAAMAQGPPPALPPPRGHAGSGGRRPPPVRRTPAPYIPLPPGKSSLITPQAGEAVAPDSDWWLLLVDPGCEFHVRSELIARCGGAIRALAFVRPGGRQPVLGGLLALDRLCEVAGVPHVRGWVGRPVAERGPWGRTPRQQPAALSAATLARMYGRLGWSRLPGDPVADAADPSGRVRLSAGPFAGQQGQVRECRAGRVRVLLDAGLTVEVPRASVTVIG